MPEFSPQQIEAARLAADIEFQVQAQYFTPAQRDRMNRKPVLKLPLDPNPKLKQVAPVLKGR